MGNLKKTREHSLYLKKSAPAVPHCPAVWALLLRAVLREEDSPQEAKSTPCIAHLSLFNNFLQLLQRWEFVLLFLQPSVSQLSLLQWHCCDLVLRLLPCAKAGNFPFSLPLVPVWWCFTPIMKSVEFSVSSHLPPPSHPAGCVSGWSLKGAIFHFLYSKKRINPPFWEDLCV